MQVALLVSLDDCCLKLKDLNYLCWDAFGGKIVPQGKYRQQHPCVLQKWVQNNNNTISPKNYRHMVLGLFTLVELPLHHHATWEEIRAQLDCMAGEIPTQEDLRANEVTTGDHDEMWMVSFNFLLI